jgi:protein-disulfide isomerase
MDDWLYSNQETMTPESVAAALTEVAGIAPGQLEERYDEVVEQVKADIADGATLPVEATPTFIVNGVLLKGGLEPQFFDQAIAYELARASAAP